jgi:micrococcal nuclease
MESIKDYLLKNKWWIFIVFSLLAYALIFLIAFIVLFSSNPPITIVSQDQMPSDLPSPQSKLVDTPTQIQVFTQSPASPTAPDDKPTPGRELAYVERVIDGDSIEVVLDGKLYELRYIGIDAPELGVPLFADATEANRALVEKQIVELESDITDSDRYGRLLRYVYLPDGRFVNSELVGLGLAAAHAYPPDIKYQDILISKEQNAADAGLGIWAREITPSLDFDDDPIINIQVDPSCSQFNAPGNDNENKNEEFVCIINNGTDSAELSDWSMHDEYGWTYQFPLFELEGKSKVRIFTGCGIDSPQELYWCKDETAVWNNDGDCVYLQDSEGKEVATYCY